MKFTVSRVTKQNRSGTSKTGNPYALDFVEIVVSVPFNTPNAFGHKEVVYQYGKAADFSKLESLRSRLPCEVDLELGHEVDDYGNAKTVVTDVTVPPVSSLSKTA